jgi:hypothetical protein
MSQWWALGESMRELGFEIKRALPILTWCVERLISIDEWISDEYSRLKRRWHLKWLRWRVIPSLIWARAKRAWRRPIVGALGLKVCRPGGNAHDRRKQIRNVTLRPRVGIGKTVARHVRVHI